MASRSTISLRGQAAYCSNAGLAQAIQRQIEAKRIDLDLLGDRTDFVIFDSYLADFDAAEIGRVRLLAVYRAEMKRRLRAGQPAWSFFADSGLDDDDDDCMGDPEHPERIAAAHGWYALTQADRIEAAEAAAEGIF